METAITRLALHRPSDLTDDQWAYCILYTWNLHTGYGGVPSYVPTDDLERIVAEFETRIDAGPDLATIDWLWEEYFRAYPRARNYNKYWPTSPDYLARFEAGDHGGYPLSYWRSKYEQRIGNK
ncbi:MAG TPA: hypothetical protein VMM56_10670 [Planctomycetaceae bacterium]|nr:hypothetical protein [Planctomycetaceae bacterium]